VKKIRENRKKVIFVQISRKLGLIVKPRRSFGKAEEQKPGLTKGRQHICRSFPLLFPSRFMRKSAFSRSP
jgi:hypothetical protein